MYDQNFRLIIGGTEQELCDYLNKKYKVEVEPLYASAKQLTVHLPNGDQKEYIWIEKFDWTVADQGLLTHELFHYAMTILNKLGINYTADSEEAFAYYLQYIFCQTWSKLKPRFKKEEKKEG
jgi:hypothetical protein|tara:strand:- start:152 stop:517 length:366 start_codon:yes stop_codon:yes gene_type:complete